MKFFHVSIKYTKIISQSWWADNQKSRRIFEDFYVLHSTIIKLDQFDFLAVNLRTLSTRRSTGDLKFMIEGHLGHSDGNFMISRFV